jgi:hypothetical protein
VVDAQAGDNRCMRWLLLTAVVSFAGCSSPRYFTPRENVNGTGPGGYPAAVYPLGGAPSVGEVRLWSRGAEVVETEAGDLVELHVGFELENTGSEPIGVDAGALQCADLWIDGQRQPALTPTRVAGQAEAAPGSSATLDAWFRPAAARPRAIDGFSLRFSVRAGDRVLLEQAVPFAPYVANDRWRDDRFFWSGSWGRPYYWGPGFGYGFYGHYGCR